MGQKTNPNIFRLGVNKTWKTEFFEKKNRELPLYIFKDLEIQNYLKRFLEIQRIYLHDYKQHYNNSTLYLYISYFVSPEFIYNKKSNTYIPLLIFNERRKKKIFCRIKETSEIFFNKVNYNNSIHNLLTKSQKKNAYVVKRYLNKNTRHLITHLIVNLQELAISNPQILLINFFKALSLFANKNFEIVTNWCCLNKNFSFLKQFKQKKFILFQKFRKTLFLKPGLELMFHVVCNKNSTNLLANFIAIQIRKIKRHKFFLAFLKQVLTILVFSDLSEVKGIRIVLKGRLNGASRARHRIINIGNIPIHSLKAKMDYSQTSTHNSNGSYGIKVWIVEKDLSF